MNFCEKLFQTKLLSRLSHKVCRLLFSPVLLRKFTNNDSGDGDDGDDDDDDGVRACENQSPTVRKNIIPCVHWCEVSGWEALQTKLLQDTGDQLWTVVSYKIWHKCAMV